METLQTFIAVLIIFAAAFYLLWVSVLNKNKKGSPCGGCCSESCGGCSSNPNKIQTNIEHIDISRKKNQA